MDDKKLFLLDAYALIYRAYYALIGAPRITSTGFNSSAVFGFCNTLDEILRKENPSHIAVCFDPHGVGPKTASKLIREYGSVENLLANAAGIKGALGKKIQENADNIRFSKHLATIRRDVPLEVDFDTLRREPEDTERLREIFTRMEFKTFLSRLRKPATGGEDDKKASEPEKKGGETMQPSLFDFIEGEAAAVGGHDATSTGDTPGGGDEGYASLSAAGYREVTDAVALAQAVAEACKAQATGIALYAVGAEAMTADFRGMSFSPA